MISAAGGGAEGGAARATLDSSSPISGHWRLQRGGGTLAGDRLVSEWREGGQSVRKLIVGALALVAALAFTVSGALGSAEQTPGVTAKQIVIGGTFPLTGPAASYAPIPVGMRAYFAYINARKGPDGKRGVMGRRIIWKYYDDGFNPANTVQLTRKLVEEDKVFATVGQLGTEPVFAARPYLNQQRVPQVLVSTGASYWGLQYKEFPWTIGWQPDYIAEGRLYGLHVKANFAGKKIAVIYQNDDYGKDYVYGFRAALGKAYADANIVSQQAVELSSTSVAGEMVRVRGSGATVLAVFQLPNPTARTIATGKAIGYNPEQIYMNSVAAIKPATDGMIGAAGAPYVNGILSVAYLKDPSSPRWNNDAAMKQYRTIMSRYGAGVNADDPQVFYGVAKAETFVQALYKAGKNLTRARLMNALLSLNATNKFALPGVVQKTSKTDHWIISQMQLQRFNSNTRVWAPVGKLVEGRPR
jgi:branched-chain amino acid transport system substrate-binding protein